MARPWQPLLTTASGVQWFFRDLEDGNYEVFSTQENDPYLEANARLRSLDDGGYTSKSKDFRREGSVPFALINKWRAEEGVDVLHPSGHEFLKRKLNCSDWSALRTSEGKT